MNSKMSKKNLLKAEEALNVIMENYGITTNQILKELDVINKYSLEDISCGLAHYCFRNGPVEDMHADGKLSQEDMKILNKYCYDKIYTFFTMIKENKTVSLIQIINYGVECGLNWDKPEYKVED